MLEVQAHMGHVPAPISDYVTDTRSVLDQSIRILQAITDVAADAGWLGTALATMHLMQSIMQASQCLLRPDGSALHHNQHAFATPLWCNIVYTFLCYEPYFSKCPLGAKPNGYMLPH